MKFINNKIYLNDELYYTIYRRKNRIIFSPCKELKEMQKHFLNAIKLVYNLKLSTLETAKVHVNKKWILKMDIKNFYNSVPNTDIFDFVKEVCKNLTGTNSKSYFELVTIYEKLPIGAPTSAHIANACFEKIDKNIKEICVKSNVSYSRYVDDLTFSSNSKEDLNIIEKQVNQILSFNGYKVNSNKTKYISDNKRQEILGIVVNDNQTRLSYKVKKNIRTMLYKYVKTNTSPHLDLAITDCVNENQLRGYISYVKSVDKLYYARLKKYANKLEKRFNTEKLKLFKK